ncbi:MAG: hypothetical protein IKA71_06725 [Lentisphaeria bacterium]|nr:hypothetical protein [Lentisphaeria bacterium]
MIEINYADFFLLIFAMIIGYIAWLWGRESLRQKRNAWQLSNRRLFHCNNCHHHFVPRVPVSLCRCPRCNTVCIRKQSDLLVDTRHAGRSEDESAS